MNRDVLLMELILKTGESGSWPEFVKSGTRANNGSSVRAENSVKPKHFLAPLYTHQLLFEISRHRQQQLIGAKKF
jgi:hypothetical protein